MAHSVREIMNAMRWKWAALFFFMPSYFVRHFNAFNDITHLSMRTNDLKHKGSQLLTPFSSTVFMPFQMVQSIFFVVLTSKTIWMKAANWLLLKCHQVKAVSGVYTRNKMDVVLLSERGMLYCVIKRFCVPFCLRPLLSFGDVGWFDATLHKNKSQLRQDIFVQRKLGKTKLYFVRFLL